MKTIFKKPQSCIVQQTTVSLVQNFIFMKQSKSDCVTILVRTR